MSDPIAPGLAGNAGPPQGAETGERAKKACVCCGIPADSGSEYCYVCIGRGHDKPDAEDARAGAETGEWDRKACVCCGSAAAESGSGYCYVCIGRGHHEPDAADARAGE